MKKKIEKVCISCGEKGHHYNECKKVPFAGLLAGGFGINPEPFCGMCEQELIESVKENAVWNKDECS